MAGNSETAKRNKKGQFAPGKSGNPKGRPVGSKNKVNLLKLTIEEGFREVNQDKISRILNSVVSDALSGDKQCRKMIWDACISKANLSEDKNSSGDGAPQIMIRHVNAEQKGDVIELKEVGEQDE